MNSEQLEDVQVRVDDLVQRLADLPAHEHEAAAAPLLQRLEAELARHRSLLEAQGAPRGDALEELNRRELVRLVGAASYACGDGRRWQAALLDLRLALDVALLGRWGLDS